MNKRFIAVALTGLLGVLALGVAAHGGVASAAPAAQGTTPTPAPTTTVSDIGVTGTGKVFANPDTAIADVGVDITAPTLATASSNASTQMTAVVTKIKSMGVADKDIKTVSYNVNPITSNPKEGETPRITGYHVSNVVEVKIRKLDQVGPILDAAIAAGANSLNGLNFTIDDPTSLEKDARTQAVQQAMAKAKTLADAANVKLGSIISITENTSPVRPLLDRVMAAPSAAGAGIGPVQTGQNEIDVTVEIHYQIIQ